MLRLDAWKHALRSIAALDELWGGFRRWQLEREYQQRREHYARADSDYSYCEAECIGRVHKRLSDRGYHPASRHHGDVHTFAFVPRISWHSALLNDFQELGTLSVFDYAEHGYTWDEFRSASPVAIRRRREMLSQFWQQLCKAHQQRPIDWIFFYASGVEIVPDTLKRITGELGIPIVGMCLDDKQSWTGPCVDGSRFGQIDLAAHFDLSWTSARTACQWYDAEGGRAIYLPEGFDRQCYRPMNVEHDIDVSFIGGAYGFRRSLVRYLRQCDLPVHVFGPGWNTRCVWADEQVQIINRSHINLGFGGIGYSEQLTNVKTRDFEIPGTGGGMYLTTFNPDLAQHFHVGQEIVCYHSREELVELVRYYLRHPEEARQIAARGRERCLREHRWLHRYQHICRALGILNQ